jgi:predicted aldo/keto reductase-like oxidoreductase
MGKKPGLASQCIECNKRIKHCPQGIDIPAAMKQIRKEFEGPFTKPILWGLDKVMTLMKKKDT